MTTAQAMRLGRSKNLDEAMTMPRRTGAYSSTSSMWVALALVCLAVLAACQPTVAEETALFEQAEQCYLHGDYDGARLRYERFLALHETSPLAETARMRMASIDRELDSVMGRRGAPAPIRVNPFGATAVAPEMVEAPALRAPSLPELNP